MISLFLLNVVHYYKGVFLIGLRLLLVFVIF